MRVRGVEGLLVKVGLEELGGGRAGRGGSWTEGVERSEGGVGYGERGVASSGDGRGVVGWGGVGVAGDGVVVLCRCLF